MLTVAELWWQDPFRSFRHSTCRLLCFIRFSACRPSFIQACQLSHAAHQDSEDALWHRWLSSDAVQHSNIQEYHFKKNFPCQSCRVVHFILVLLTAHLQQWLSECCCFITTETLNLLNTCTHKRHELAWLRYLYWIQWQGYVCASEDQNLLKCSLRVMMFQQLSFLPTDSWNRLQWEKLPLEPKPRLTPAPDAAHFLKRWHARVTRSYHNKTKPFQEH